MQCLYNTRLNNIPDGRGGGEGDFVSQHEQAYLIRNC